jgi:hypothetical protein
MIITDNKYLIATPFLSFNYTLIRNLQLDNTLSASDSSMLSITSKNEQIITIDNLPDHIGFDSSGWIAMLCDANKTSTPSDPTATGDYSYKSDCDIIRNNKTLTFPIAYDLTDWEVNDNLVLYNPFLNYHFVGDQTSDPLISVSGAPAWRVAASVGGPIWKHSNGTYYRLFSGYNSYSIGYATSPDMISWTMGNDDNPIVTPASSGLTNCTYLVACGNIIKISNGNYCIPVGCARSDTTPTQKMAIMYFNEDASNISFSDYISFSGTDIYGIGEGSILKIGSYYHILCRTTEALAVQRKIVAAKSLDLEGPYTTYQTVVDPSNNYANNDGVAWSNNVDAPLIGQFHNNIFGLFAGFSRWSPSGNKGNREYCLLDFDPSTEIWSINQIGPVIWNPLYFQDIYGNYDWAGDHMGAEPAMFIEKNDIYFVCSMRGIVYQTALIKLNIINYI